MDFEIWATLDLKNNIEEQRYNLQLSLSSAIIVYGSRVDNEGTFKAKVNIENLNQLLDLPYILGGDIVLYGADSDIIMSVKTLQELSLD
jgi:hypothetical protein